MTQCQQDEGKEFQYSSVTLDSSELTLSTVHWQASQWYRCNVAASPHCHHSQYSVSACSYVAKTTMKHTHYTYTHNLHSQHILPAHTRRQTRYRCLLHTTFKHHFLQHRKLLNNTNTSTHTAGHHDTETCMSCQRLAKLCCHQEAQNTLA